MPVLKVVADAPPTSETRGLESRMFAIKVGSIPHCCTVRRPWWHRGIVAPSCPISVDLDDSRPSPVRKNPSTKHRLPALLVLAWPGSAESQMQKKVQYRAHPIFSFWVVLSSRIPDAALRLGNSWSRLTRWPFWPFSALAGSVVFLSGQYSTDCTYSHGACD